MKSFAFLFLFSGCTTVVRSQVQILNLTIISCSLAAVHTPSALIPFISVRPLWSTLPRVPVLVPRTAVWPRQLQTSHPPDAALQPKAPP